MKGLFKGAENVHLFKHRGWTSVSHEDTHSNSFVLRMSTTVCKFEGLQQRIAASRNEIGI